MSERVLILKGGPRDGLEIEGLIHGRILNIPCLDPAWLDERKEWWHPCAQYSTETGNYIGIDYGEPPLD